jgi:hypothetical protein
MASMIIMVTKPPGPSLRHLSPSITIRRHTRYGFDSDCETFRA